MARKYVRGYRRARVLAPQPRPMIGLSVAVGRFVEALFWAILRVAGMIGGAVLVAMLALAFAWWLIRRRR
ncbi:hypothetical protein SOM26_13540 [Sphingomonas sp. CFBP8993]|uniref:hypothetical protein n=1 Tax=Sphingomonas sp. CFBP8993 TaxID=3096526 RepID=UPI002A6B7A9F|nr:hypothetical protein [Sphingomonas sp. CFBP8993]MDY0959712.1 hypothetical protein [Sphingomonas sp. CFBP8993]